MKMLLCLQCQDCVKLPVLDWRYCQCRKSAGRYLEDGWHSEIWGNAIMLGLDSNTLAEAIHNRADPTRRNFRAFIIGDDSPRVKRVEKVELLSTRNPQ